MTVYSPSRLSTFDNCPKQFEFRYIQKIQRDTESIEAFVGKRVHEILERLYHHVARHSRPPSLRQVLDRKAWCEATGCAPNKRPIDARLSRDGTQIAVASDAELYRTVSEGRPLGMPPWKSQLSSDKIWKVLAYIETLPKTDEPGVGSPDFVAAGAGSPGS